MAQPGAEDGERLTGSAVGNGLRGGSAVVVVPEKFDGTTDFDTWVSNFECVSTINGWTNDEKRLWMCVSLKGRAHVAYNCFDHETQKSYDAVKAALQERFEPQWKSTIYRTEFEKCHKAGGDSWLDFSDRLMILTRKAFPELRSESLEVIALKKFLDQLQDPRISLAVKQLRPKTLREAASATMEQESYLLTLPATSNVDVEFSTTPEPAGENLDILKGLYELTGRVEKLEVGLTRETNESTNPTRAQTAYKGVTACYRCGRVGHYARGCALQTGNSSDLAANGDTQNALKCVAINNVSSYVLSCNVHGTPVSFLIDTGAGVSLLDQQVWEKIKSLAGDLKVVTNHRLVGVDGIPLKVLGSVTAPLSIAEAHFSHEFIVAEGLTTDAILGLDFLEANKCVLDLAKGNIIIADRSISLIPNPSSQHSACSNVTVLQKYVIPPHSELEIAAHLDSQEAGTWLIEGTPSESAKVLVARVLTKPQNHSVVLRVVNTDVSPVTLYKNSKIATAELINDSAICTTSEQGEGSVRSDHLAANVPLTLPDDIATTQKEQFLALLSHYADIIAANPDDLGRTTVMQHSIDTGNATPIRQQARRVPLPRRETVRTLLNEMLEKGIITPSKSPWASPIVLVKKKDGT